MNSSELTVQELAGMFDQTLLKPNAESQDFKKLCDESMKYNFKMVAINCAAIERCKNYLKDSSVCVGGAVGFPLGQSTIATKVFETKDAINTGADEIDYVINIAELKNGNWEYIENEMNEIINLCKSNQVTSKVIFENCYLTDEEKKRLCDIALKVQPDFIKTSTGFGDYGARVEDVKLMKQCVGDKIKVKASGGIRDLKTTIAMIEAGAERIGTSSGVKIIEEYMKAKQL